MKSRSRLDQAAAARQQAESDLKRATDLMQQKILSQSEFDNAQSKFRMADAAEAEAKTMLDYTMIVAPFDGVITRKLADVGDLAAPGKPLLQMENPDTLRLEADVPEALIGNVKLGDRLAVRIAGVTNEIDRHGRRNVARRRPEQPHISGETGFAGRGGFAFRPVRPRRRARWRGERDSRSRFRRDSARADGNWFLSSPTAHAQLRLVKTGTRVGDEVEVVSGLDSGEQVVTEGAAALTDGQPVTVKP